MKIYSTDLLNIENDEHFKKYKNVLVIKIIKT